jgi:3-phenylpropionate/cinnamic acid dioxygenase small subunit
MPNHDPNEVASILNTVYEYAYSLDEKKFDLFADCFSKDATVDIVVHNRAAPVPHLCGRDAIVEFFQTGRAAHRDRRRHVVTNARVGRRDDGAHVHSYVVLYSTEGGTTRLLCTGQYFDDLVREDGRWRIKKKVIDLDAMYA